METCADCKYFVNHQIMGVCRLYPQQVNKHSKDWCGQFLGVEKVYDIKTDTVKRKYTRKANVQAPA